MHAEPVPGGRLAVVQELSIFGVLVCLTVKQATPERNPHPMTTYLAPIDKPEGLMLKLGYRYTRRQSARFPDR